MAKNTKKALEEILSPVIEALGYEYVETDFSKQGKDYILTIYIDSENGIDLQDCEKVSRAIDPILDEHDLIEQSYYLCVSSLGLDRPLKTEKDFEKGLGTCIDIKLYKNLDGKKLYSGRLTGYTQDSITIETADNNAVTIALKDAAKITPHIDF